MDWIGLWVKTTAAIRGGFMMIGIRVFSSSSEMFPVCLPALESFEK